MGRVARQRVLIAKYKAFEDAARGKSLFIHTNHDTVPHDGSTVQIRRNSDHFAVVERRQPTEKLPSKKSNHKANP